MSRRSFVLSPRAQHDLDEIWDFTAKRWGVDQADTYLHRLGHSIASIAQRPMIGRACPEIRAGYFKYRSGSHVVFYRVTDGMTDVVRILHMRMDFDQHL